MIWDGDDASEPPSGSDEGDSGAQESTRLRWRWRHRRRAGWAEDETEEEDAALARLRPRLGDAGDWPPRCGVRRGSSGGDAKGR